MIRRRNAAVAKPPSAQTPHAPQAATKPSPLRLWAGLLVAVVVALGVIILGPCLGLTSIARWAQRPQPPPLPPPLPPPARSPAAQQPGQRAAQQPTQENLALHTVQQHEQQHRVPPRTVWWFAPFFSGSGMGQEALQLVLGLQEHTVYAGRLWISSHGDLDSWEVFSALPPAAQKQLAHMAQGPAGASLADAATAIIVCHSEPGAWALPAPLYQTSLCPPLPVGQAAYVVARAMWEADRPPAKHVERLNQMSEVWVPTEHHRTAFEAAGVAPAKLRVVPEPVDAAEFDPAAHRPLRLPLGTNVFGPAWPHARAAAAESTGGGSSSSDNGSGSSSAAPFVFLSVFKWEQRKGWDVLLRAFLSAFTADDNVLLLLATKPFHSDSNFAEQMQAWAQQELGAAAADAASLPSVYVLSEHIPQPAFPRLYRSADCFVLPTRGEGWGLPIAEAMAMGLPAIATNWSGPTAYLDEGVGYPLRIEGLAPAQGDAFAGQRWAQPSVEHLAQLMRHVASHRQEAAAKGRAARRRMAEHYSPAAVAAVVARQLQRIEAQLAGG